MKPLSADNILDALIATSDDKIWATELTLFSGKRRIDFWTLEPIGSAHFRACAYEIKVSRSDFLRDGDDKQAGALQWSDRFWYVTPPGLVQLSELPDYAGLQEWDGERFAVKRRAPMRQKAPPDWEFIVSLLRNSGDCRRDVGLLKAQLSYFQFEAERSRERTRLRNKAFMDRFARRMGTTPVNGGP
ncbi:MAG TPA: hypothetical protein VGF56_05825 [Rhizomicrobium sp.]|jgi:hypothetical protein